MSAFFIFLSVVAICATVLRLQNRHDTARFNQAIQDRDALVQATTKRIDELFVQEVASQKAIDKMARLVVDLMKKQNIKMSPTDITNPPPPPKA